MISYFIFGSTWIFVWFCLCFLTLNSPRNATRNHDGHLVKPGEFGSSRPSWGGFFQDIQGRQSAQIDWVNWCWKILFLFCWSSLPCLLAWSTYFNNTTFFLKFSKASSFEIFVYYEHNFIRHLQMLGVRNGENVAKPHILSAFIFVISHAIVLMSKMLSNATKLRWKTVRAKIV